ncbi:Electron transport complex protein RnfE [Candidatus Izimaplasma bacterium HR1]|jgi:electron transport complex protein RnfE|uniref:electron transport complex subunit RsxE n=1 Tax=Candidatus Izimoplasma sp. HR1 TaxID=1541959 RepID=UPI0004F6D67D|nr:Electron transport complex protein RnfE [Candidatus Izimaplasma bacterium HR1]
MAKEKKGRKKKRLTPKQNLIKGLFKENPTFVLVLGMCPTLGVTTSLENALGMGLSVVFVLILTNALIASIRNIVPNEIRIPVYIVLIALVVTLIEWSLNAFMPDLYDALGIYLPLIVVNCIILGRAEAYASDNTVFDSIFDGMGMGLGFTLGLSTLAITRELFGTGSIALLGITLYESSVAASFLISPPGAFLTLGLLIGIINTVRIGREKKAKAIMDAKIKAALAKKAAKQKALEEQNQKESIIKAKGVLVNE